MLEPLGADLPDALNRLRPSSSLFRERRRVLCSRYTTPLGAYRIGCREGMAHRPQSRVVDQVGQDTAIVGHVVIDQPGSIMWRGRRSHGGCQSGSSPDSGCGQHWSPGPPGDLSSRRDQGCVRPEKAWAEHSGYGGSPISLACCMQCRSGRAVLPSSPPRVPRNRTTQGAPHSGKTGLQSRVRC